MADINDRLERLNRREEFARRAHPRPVVNAPTGGRGDDFAEVLDAVARAVLRHPGLSVLVTTGDSGQRGRTVVRVTERDGSVETAVVAPRAAPAAEPRNSGRHAEPTHSVAAPPSAGPPAGPTSPTAARPVGVPANGGGTYQRPIGEREPYPRPGAARALRAVDESPPEPASEPDDAAGTDGRPDGPEGNLPAADPGSGRSGLLALPPDTSQVVARLAQLLRDDPSLAAGWARGR